MKVNLLNQVDGQLNILLVKIKKITSQTILHWSKLDLTYLCG